MHAQPEISQVMPSRSPIGSAAVMPWFFGLLQRVNRRRCVKPSSKDQILTGNLSNLLVPSLEGIQGFIHFSALCDNTGGFYDFDSQRLISLSERSPTFLKDRRQLAPCSRASGGDRKSPLQQKPPGRCDRTGRQKGSTYAVKKYTRPRRITSSFLHAQSPCRCNQTEPAQVCLA